jgi:hypothetical protein
LPPRVIHLAINSIVAHRKFCMVPLVFLWTITAHGQISPPGLDGAKLISWGAVGVNQQFGKKWSTTLYFGGSTQSDPDNFATFQKSGIFVLNQETLFRVSHHWQVAFCTSLRRQFQYEDQAPFSKEDPPWKKEIRYYTRLFYRYEKGSTTFLHSFRTEYRTFYAPDGEPWTQPVQVRLRLKLQANIALNDAKSNLFIVANEWLFANEKDSQGAWSSFHFTEDRLSTFYRHIFQKPRLYLDLGMMHQLRVRGSNLEYATYLSVDLLFQNPFGTPRQE